MILPHRCLHQKSPNELPEQFKFYEYIQPKNFCHTRIIINIHLKFRYKMSRRKTWNPLKHKIDTSNYWTKTPHAIGIPPLQNQCWMLQLPAILFSLQPLAVPASQEWHCWRQTNKRFPVHKCKTIKTGIVIDTSIYRRRGKKKHPQSTESSNRILQSINKK